MNRLMWMTFVAMLLLFPFVKSGCKGYTAIGSGATLRFPNGPVYGMRVVFHGAKGRPFSELTEKWVLITAQRPREEESEGDESGVFTRRYNVPAAVIDFRVISLPNGNIRIEFFDCGDQEHCTLPGAVKRLVFSVCYCYNEQTDEVQECLLD